MKQTCDIVNQVGSSLILADSYVELLSSSISSQINSVFGIQVCFQFYCILSLTGCFIMLIVLFYDNTWFLLNVYVQSIGYYLQYIVQLGFHTGTTQSRQQIEEQF